MNDLVQLHTFEPQSVGLLERELRARVDPRWLERWAALDVALSGPWRPADRWPGAAERLVWTSTFRLPEGRLFSTDGEREAAGTNGIGRRQVPATAAELLAPAFGAALALWHSDAGQSVVASLWRDRRLRHSLRVDSGVRAVRCDGERVIVEAPPRHLPEIDRAGVLLAAWARFLGEPLPLDGADRFFFADALAELTAGVPDVSLVAPGAWYRELVRAVGGK
jgi:hypothetical protein